MVHGVGDLRVEELPWPVPAADEAVLRIAFGGICGSDLHYWLHGAAGESVLMDPMVLGHEVVGTVVQRASDGTGPAAGTRVAVHPATEGAGDGSPYPADRPNLSPGGTYLGSAARRPHTNGAFASYVALPARMLRTLPETLPLRRAALIEPASVAWHAVSRGGDPRGKDVAVVGCGPIGLLAIAVLASRGARSITAIDIADAPLRTAAAVGASRILRAEDSPALSGINADIAIEASGSSAGLATAISATGRGGRVVLVGLLPPGAQPVPVSLAIARELELIGSFRFNDEIDDVIQALAAAELVVDPVVSHVFPVTKALAAFETARNPVISSKVLLQFDETAG